MDYTKMNPKYTDSPRRELSVLGLGFVVAVLAHSGIDFSCAYTGGPIQLYLVVFGFHMVFNSTSLEIGENWI